MINWSLESEDAVLSTYVYRYSVLGKTIEVRAVLDKAINKFKLRFVSIKPSMRMRYRYSQYSHHTLGSR